MTFSSMRAIYDELKAFAKKPPREPSRELIQDPCQSRQGRLGGSLRRLGPRNDGCYSFRSTAASPRLTLRKTQSRDRETWRDSSCCCRQRANEVERKQRHLIEENVELRRLCLYLDKQRLLYNRQVKDLKQQRAEPAYRTPPALPQDQPQYHQVQQQPCCYAPPCCSQPACDFQASCCALNEPARSNSLKWSESPAANSEDRNAESGAHDEELLAYIRALEERVLLLEEERDCEHVKGRAQERATRAVCNVNVQTSFTSTVDSFSSNPYSIQSEESYTPQAATENDLKLLHATDMQTSQSSGTTYGSSSFDDADEENISVATTVYRGTAHPANNNNNNNNNKESGATKPADLGAASQRAATDLVRRFLSTRENFIESLRRVHSPEYAVIRRASWNRGTAQERRQRYAYAHSVDVADVNNYCAAQRLIQVEKEVDLPPKLELISTSGLAHLNRKNPPTIRKSA